jgi:hypothetical protein
MNMLDDVEFQIAKLSLGPDDLLVVRSAKPLTSVMAAELRARLERQFNLTGRIMVIDAGFDLAVVTSNGTKPDVGLDAKAAGAAPETKPSKGASKT